MSLSKVRTETESSRSARRTILRDEYVRQQLATMTGQLASALAREKALLREKADFI